MNLPSFIKKKRTYVIAILLIGGFAIYRYRSNANATPAFETTMVERRDLLQTVEVTGQIKPAARIELGFKNNGTIRGIGVKVGEAVKAGQILAELENDNVLFAARSAAASLSVARANLRVRQAGETSQSIRVAEAQVEQAQASYDKAVSDLSSTQKTTADAIRTSEVALNTAKNNLANQEAIITQNVNNAIESARASLLTAVGPLNTTLSDGDQISGVDNTAANSAYVNLLGFLDFGSLERSKNSYSIAKVAKEEAEVTIKTLTTASSQTDVQNAAAKLQKAIELVQAYATDVQKVLAASLTNGSLTESVLATKRATIDADRISVSNQNSTVTTALQGIKNTSLVREQTGTQLQDAFVSAQLANDTAVTNAAVQIRAGETAIAVQKANLDQANAQLDQKKSGPRTVDLEPLIAAVEQAQVNADKASADLKDIQIIAPVDGIISEVIPDVGEQATVGSIAIKMIGTATFDIEAQVPEADVSKIKVGQSASITLDAYGDDIKFTGTVSAKDPAETKIQDAVYYKIRVQIEPGDKEVKPGMTANVTIQTGESKNTLVIPLRAVRTKSENGQKTVRTLENNQPVEKNIDLGLRGDEGRVEVTKGLNEKEQVIVGETASGKSIK
ncbi:efflux RND transporter periplasmic adaptor subunit [Candidatus Uhrbacteria bacterium]|nr:efflux RND transporter periplasmic adaptor subunit [Candidatus Uhrbacteria bacterium]